jgi:hypothetical protein
MEPFKLFTVSVHAQLLHPVLIPGYTHRIKEQKMKKIKKNMKVS